MTEQAIVPFANRVMKVSDLKEGETLPVEPGALSRDGQDRLFVSAYAEGNKYHYLECARVTKEANGFSADFSNCSDYDKSISAKTTPDDIEMHRHLPVMKVAGLDSGASSWIDSVKDTFARFTGKQAEKNEEQVVVPTRFKSGTLSEFKVGESAYVYPENVLFNGDGHAALKSLGVSAEGKASYSKCAKVDILSQGVNVDLSECSASSKKFLGDTTQSAEVRKYNLEIHKLSGL